MSPAEAQALFGLAGTVFGGASLKLVDYFYNKGVTKDSIATELRAELRQEAQDLQNRVDKLSAEVDEWKQKYYDLLGQIYALKKEMADADILAANQKSQIDKYEAIDKHPRKG